MGQQLGIAALALIIFGVLYNALYAWLERTGRAEGYTAFIVAGGEIVILCAVVVVYGPHIAGGLLALQAAAGLPMIVGSWWRHTNRRRAEDTRAAQIAAIALDTKDGE